MFSVSRVVKSSSAAGESARLQAGWQAAGGLQWNGGL